MRVFLKGRGVLSAVSIAVMFACVPARAADVEDVESMIRQGVELRHQGHDVLALPLFHKAYGLARTPRAAGQLGLCEMAIGYWVDAESHLAEALSFPEHPWVKKNLDDLTGSLASVRKNISEVIVDGGPSGAEVMVNGQSVGNLPLSAPLRLGKGVVDVEVRSPGYAAVTRRLRITGSVVERLTIVLAKAPQFPPEQAQGGNPAAVVAADPTTGREVGEPSKANPRRIAAWATAGGAGVALVLGVVETIAWSSKQSQFDNHVAPPSASDPTAKPMKDCGSAEQNYGGLGCQGLHDELAQARLLTIVGYGLAGALGVTAAVLFANSRDDRTKTTAALVCAPDVVGRSVGCRITF